MVFNILLFTIVIRSHFGSSCHYSEQNQSVSDQWLLLAVLMNCRSWLLPEAKVAYHEVQASLLKKALALLKKAAALEEQPFQHFWLLFLQGQAQRQKPCGSWVAPAQRATSAAEETPLSPVPIFPLPAKMTIRRIYANLTVGGMIWAPEEGKDQHYPFSLHCERVHSAFLTIKGPCCSLEVFAAANSAPAEIGKNFGSNRQLAPRTIPTHAGPTRGSVTVTLASLWWLPSLYVLCPAWVTPVPQSRLRHQSQVHWSTSASWSFLGASPGGLFVIQTRAAQGACYCIKVEDHCCHPESPFERPTLCESAHGDVWWCMQIKEHSAQLCPICQRPWQACYDQTYVHQANSKKQKEQWDSNKGTSLHATGPTPPDITGKGGQQTAHDDWQRHEESVPATSLPPQTILGTHQWWVNRCSLFHLAQLWCPYWGCLPRTHDAASYADHAGTRAVLEPSRHFQAWKTFLAKSMSNWQKFAKQFMQHENDLQERITSTKDIAIKAEVDFDQARQEAGEEEENLPGTAAGSSVEKVTQSIQKLASSEAATLEVDEPHVANRQRVEQPSRDDVNPCSPLSRLVNHDPRVCWPTAIEHEMGSSAILASKWSHSIEEEDVFCLSGVHGKMPIFLDLMLPWTKSIIGQPQVVPRLAETVSKFSKWSSCHGKIPHPEGLAAACGWKRSHAGEHEDRERRCDQRRRGATRTSSRIQPHSANIVWSCTRCPAQIQQWKYGAQAIKPTTIRVIGLPPSAKFLHAQTIPVLRRLEGFLQEEINPQHILRPPGPCPASYFCTNLCTGLTQRQRSEGLAVRCLQDQAWLVSVAGVSARNFSSHYFPDYQSQCWLSSFVPHLQEATVSAAAEKVVNFWAVIKWLLGVV